VSHDGATGPGGRPGVGGVAGAGRVPDTGGVPGADGSAGAPAAEGGADVERSTGPHGATDAPTAQASAVGAVGAATPRERPGRRTAGAVVALWAALVVVAALAWWLGAPQPPVLTDGVRRVSPGEPELLAAQDGWFVAVTAAAGAVGGLVVLRRRGGPTASAVVVGLVAAGVGAVVARVLGGALGGLLAGPRRAPALPADVADRVAEGVTVQDVPGLVLSADVALVVAPLAVALVVVAVLVVTLLRSPAEPRTEDPDADAGSSPDHPRAELDRPASDRP